MRDLATGIVEIIGTAGTPPTGGYWFDSYNSEQTIKATMDKIRNFGIASFLKNRSVGDEIAKIFGGDLLPILSRANEVFAEAEQVQFVRSLDSAFEYSEAAADLSSPPSTKPDFLYRICILSVIVDRLGVRLPTEQRDTGSLKALKNWLATRAENEVVQSMTAAFAHVKDLRKQYPIHEHYVADSEGQLIVRSELQRAEEYFAFKPHHDWSAKWKLVVDSFQDAVEVLIELETPGQATSPKLAEAVRRV